MIKEYVKNTMLNSTQLELFNTKFAKDFIAIKKIVNKGSLNDGSKQSFLIQFLDLAFYSTAKDVLGEQESMKIAQEAEVEFGKSMVTFVKELYLVELLKDMQNNILYATYQQLYIKLWMSRAVYKLDNDNAPSDAINEEIRYILQEALDLFKNKSTVH